jgi:hypothetical protein
MWYTKDTQSESPGSWNDSLGPWSAKVSSHLNWIADASKGHFTLQWLVEKSKDSNNLIGWKRKFVFWTFTLEPTIKGQSPQKLLHGNTFCKFWHQGFGLWAKVCTILMETQTLLKMINFSFQTYANSTIHIF